jgi:uncharacterized protein (AIM24 family)
MLRQEILLYAETGNTIIVNESNFLIAMSNLFHSFTVEGINDELVIKSLQKGTIK